MSDRTGKVGSAASLPGAAEKKHSFSLEARSRMQIEGVTEVVSFDDACVELRTAAGDMTVEGRELKLGSLDTERGCVTVNGTVSGVFYPAERPSRRRRIRRSNE